MKRVILVMVFITGFDLYALAGNIYLSVKLKENPSQFFLIDEHPNVFFDEKTMHIVTSKQDVEFNITNVLEFYFSNASGIDVPANINEDIVISFPDKDNIKIDNSGASAIIQLYHINGIRVKCDISYPDSKTVRITLNNLPNGVYILSINGHQSFKFTRK